MSKKNIQKVIIQEKGAAAVEFAFALMALLVFFAIFMQFAMFFISGERLSFAGFAASRTYAVHGHGPAIHAAGQIDPGAAIDFTGDAVVLTKDIPLPPGIAEILTRGQNRMSISHSSPAFWERPYNDDNPVPFD